MEKVRNLVFRFLRFFVRLFYRKPEIIGLENLPQEPCILVGNHSQMHGPIIGELFFPDAYTWCAGQMEGDMLTVWAPDEITYGRLDNDRVRTALQETAAEQTGQPVRLALRVGEAPKAAPQENLKNLLKFGSQFDNIEIK